MKIGLIQTRGIGDIVIAAPIGQYYASQGDEVFWPVDSRFHPFVQAAFPEITFLPIDPAQTGSETLRYFLTEPFAELQKVGCTRIHCLYSHLSGLDIVNRKLAHSLKFDEYKYAVANVPFSLKWNLRVTRNKERESVLLNSLNIEKQYALIHEEGSNFKLDIQLPQDVIRDYQLIKITQASNNPFDWLGVIERAGIFVCVDSCFANLAEQLNLCSRKFLFLRSEIRTTPVFKNNWQFR